MANIIIPKVPTRTVIRNGKVVQEHVYPPSVEGTFFADIPYNRYDEGGDTSRYKGLIYNPADRWSYEQNDIGEVLYPSFQEWANGNKWNDTAPDWMFKEDYHGSRTYGAVYDNFVSSIQQYNTARRIADRKAHPEKYRGDLHNYINQQRRNAGLGNLGDTGDLNVFAYPIMGAMALPLASGLAGTGVGSAIAQGVKEGIKWGLKNIGNIPIKQTTKLAAKTLPLPLFWNTLKSIKYKNDSQPTNSSTIYLNYPQYQGSLTKGYPGASMVGSVLGEEATAPVGHNAFILADGNGGTEYYEYGRYNENNVGNGNILGVYKEGKGNWVRRRIPNMLNQESAQDYIQRLVDTHVLPHSDSGEIQATEINNTYNDKIREYVMSQANDSNRTSYNLLNTCAGQGKEAVMQGIGNFGSLSGDLNKLKSLTRGIIDSNGWGLIPFSSQSIGSDLAGYGKTYYYSSTDK